MPTSEQDNHAASVVEASPDRRVAEWLRSDHDLDCYRSRYERCQRLQVRDLLVPDRAQQLRDLLEAQSNWNLVYRAADNHVDSNALAVSGWPADQRRKLDLLIYDGARYGFQYRYANIPIYDIYHQQQLPGHFFNTVFRFLNSEPFLGLVRGITGDDSISFADAQATRFTGGDFLTCHDDAVDGKNRRIAYVLGLTRAWRPDWGGALSFPDDGDLTIESWLPGYNTLNLFRVPTRHFVGVVAPFAAAARYSITGWLRSGIDPAEETGPGHRS